MRLCQAVTGDRKTAGLSTTNSNTIAIGWHTIADIISTIEAVKTTMVR